MTQIEKINETIVMQLPKKPGTSAVASFSASLENALSQQIGKNVDRGHASALREPQPPTFNQPDTLRTNVVDQTDRLLKLLESYAAGLETPGATLKELASVVARMKDEAEHLMASAGINTGDGNDINSIAAKAALTANVEYIKFQRGDYI